MGHRQLPFLICSALTLAGTYHVIILYNDSFESVLYASLLTFVLPSKADRVPLDRCDGANSRESGSVKNSLGPQEAYALSDLASPYHGVRFAALSPETLAAYIEHTLQYLI